MAHAPSLSLLHTAHRLVSQLLNPDSTSLVLLQDRRGESKQVISYNELTEQRNKAPQIRVWLTPMERAGGGGGVVAGTPTQKSEKSTHPLPSLP